VNLRTATALILLLTLAVVLASGTILPVSGDGPTPCLATLVLDAVEDEPLTVDLSSPLEQSGLSVENVTIDTLSSLVVGIDGLNVTFLFPNGVLEANITLDVYDGDGHYTLVVLFTVEPVNDPPRFLYRPPHLPDAEVGTFYSFNLTVEDEDDPLEDLTFSTNSSFLHMVDGEIAFMPEADQVGSNLFNVTVTDPGGLSDTLDLELFVGPLSSWFLHYIPPQQAREGFLWSFNISEYLDYDFDNTPPYLRLNFSYGDDSTSILTNAETGEVTWTPTNDDVGDHFFTITVTDSRGRTDGQEIKVTVPGQGTLPPIMGHQRLTQDVPYVNTVLSDWYYNEPYMFETLTFSNEPDDLFQIDALTGRIAFVPRNEDVGTWEVVIAFTDSFGLSDSMTVLFTVANVNDPPLLAEVPEVNAIEGEAVQLTLEARDPDLDGRKVAPGILVDPEETLRFSGGPAGSSLDPVTGDFEFVPNQYHADKSPFHVVFSVVDAIGEIDYISVMFTVEDVVTAPEVHILGLVDHQKLTNGKIVRLRAVSVDESGGPWAENYAWYRDNELIGQGPVIDWKVRGHGTEQLTLVGNNGDGVEARASINISVSETPYDPGLDPTWLRFVTGGVIALLLMWAIVWIFAPKKVSRGDR